MLLAGDRKIPATMSTQHPDNANLPEWCNGTLIEGEMEVYEAYFAYSQLGCQEVMWDSEGKDVDTRVVRKMLDKFPEFFVEHELGRDIFLTYRVPNPKIEGAERKVFVETLYNIAVACDVASTFYMRDVTPIFEVILPYTTDGVELVWLHNYYRNVIAAADEILLGEEVKVKSWIGSFRPKSIKVIPLIEDYDSMLAADRIVEQYIVTVKPKYMRAFIARSDPALNYGLLCAVLLSKIAFSKLKLLEEKMGVNIHLILGVGSMPFRGHLSPDNVEKFMDEYKGLSTVTIQSALKYDYPLDKARELVNTLNRRLPNGDPQIIDSAEEEGMTALLKKSRRFYERIVEDLAPLINSVASYVPARRARKLHIGLFGYSRRVGAISLPRAIPFAAALYSLGIPPEVLGGRVLAELSDGEWKLMEKNYVNLRHDLNAVAGYLSWRNIEMIDALCNSISEKVSMSKENLKKVLKEVLSDIKAIEETLGISFGPRKLSERKHENHVNNFLISFLEGDNVGASMSLLEAAKIRKCLG